MAPTSGLLTMRAQTTKIHNKQKICFITLVHYIIVLYYITLLYCYIIFLLYSVNTVYYYSHHSPCGGSSTFTKPHETKINIHTLLVCIQISCFHCSVRLRHFSSSRNPCAHPSHTQHAQDTKHNRHNIHNRHNRHNKHNTQRTTKQNTQNTHNTHYIHTHTIASFLALIGEGDRVENDARNASAAESLLFLTFCMHFGSP